MDREEGAKGLSPRWSNNVHSRGRCSI